MHQRYGAFVWSVFTGIMTKQGYKPQDISLKVEAKHSMELQKGDWHCRY